MNTSEKIALNEVLKTFMLKDFKRAKSFCHNIIRTHNGYVDIVFYRVIAECCILEGNLEEFKKISSLYENLFSKPLGSTWRKEKMEQTHSFGDCVYFPKGRVGNDVSMSELTLFQQNLFKNQIGRLVLTDIAFDDLTEQSENWFGLANKILAEIKKSTTPLLLHIITGNSVEYVFSNIEAQKFQLNLFQWSGDKASYNVLADRLFKRDGIISPDYKDKWAFNVQIQEIMLFNEIQHLLIKEEKSGSVFVEPQVEEPTTDDWKRILEIAKLAQDENKVVELSLEKVRFMSLLDAKLLTDAITHSPNIYLVGNTNFMVYTLLQFIDQYR